MKHLLLALALLIPAIAPAEDLVRCSTEERDEKGQIVLGPTEINFKEGYIFRNGVKAPILKSKSAPVQGVKELARDWRACGPFSPDTAIERKRFACTNEVMAKHIEPMTNSDEITGMGKTGVMLMLINNSFPESEGGSQFDIEIEKIASVNAHQLDRTNKFGIPGIYEYFDKAGRLLGRFLINVPIVLQCK